MHLLPLATDLTKSKNTQKVPERVPSETVETTGNASKENKPSKLQELIEKVMKQKYTKEAATTMTEPPGSEKPSDDTGKNAGPKATEVKKADVAGIQTKDSLTLIQGRGVSPSGKSKTNNTDPNPKTSEQPKLLASPTKKVVEVGNKDDTFRPNPEDGITEPTKTSEDTKKSFRNDPTKVTLQTKEQKPDNGKANDNITTTSQKPDVLQSGMYFKVVP